MCSLYYKISTCTATVLINYITDSSAANNTPLDDHPHPRSPSVYNVSPPYNVVSGVMQTELCTQLRVYVYLLPTQTAMKYANYKFQL